MTIKTSEIVDEFLKQAAPPSKARMQEFHENLQRKKQQRKTPRKRLDRPVKRKPEKKDKDTTDYLKEKKKGRVREFQEKQKELPEEAQDVAQDFAKLVDHGPDLQKAKGYLVSKAPSEVKNVVKDFVNQMSKLPEEAKDQFYPTLEPIQESDLEAEKAELEQQLEKAFPSVLDDTDEDLIDMDTEGDLIQQAIQEVDTGKEKDQAEEIKEKFEQGHALTPDEWDFVQKKVDEVKQKDTEETGDIDVSQEDVNWPSEKTRILEASSKKRFTWQLTPQSCQSLKNRLSNLTRK